MNLGDRPKSADSPWAEDRPQVFAHFVYFVEKQGIFTDGDRYGSGFIFPLNLGPSSTPGRTFPRSDDRSGCFVGWDGRNTPAIQWTIFEKWHCERTEWDL